MAVPTAVVAALDSSIKKAASMAAFFIAQAFIARLPIALAFSVYVHSVYVQLGLNIMSA
jgi:hypothetical protein